MPTTSTLSADEKSKVKAAVPSSQYKIQTATPARIYYAYPDTSKWSYTGLEGALAFAKDSSRNVFHFKMVDISGTRGVIWEQELYEGFEYYEDRTYFHTFEGDVSFVIFGGVYTHVLRTAYSALSNENAGASPRWPSSSYRCIPPLVSHTY